MYQGKMKLFWIAILMFLLAGCADLKGKCFVGESPYEIQRKFGKIKAITLEEATNNGIYRLNQENPPFLVKPSKYNNWKGEITFNRDIRDQFPLLQVAFTGNEVCVSAPLGQFKLANVNGSLEKRADNAASAIADRIQKLK